MQLHPEPVYGRRDRCEDEHRNPHGAAPDFYFPKARNPRIRYIFARNAPRCRHPRDPSKTMHPKTMRCILFVSILCTFTVMLLCLRYFASRSPAFLKRDALERVHAQLEIGRSPSDTSASAAADPGLRTEGKKGVEDQALVLDAANHSRQKVVNIMLWKRDHMDRFWGPGQTNRVLSRGNMCSPSCRYFSSDDVHRFKDKPLDAVVIYAGHASRGGSLWQQWLSLGDGKPKTGLSVVWHTEGDDDESKARTDAKQHLRISYSFGADIEFSQACGGLLTLQNEIIHHPEEWKTIPSKSKGVAAAISNCSPRFRQSFVSKFMEHVKVDQYGGCFHNTKRKQKRGNWHEEKQELFHDYRFALALENKIGPGYVTEKIWDALQARAIPLYWGTDDIYKFLPADKFLMVKEGDSVESVAKRTRDIEQDADLYASFHRWDIAELNRTIDRFKCNVHPLCQLCALVQDRTR